MHWSCFRNSVKGLQPDARVWTLVINGLCREGLLDEAYKAFRLMKEDGRPPDNCSYNVFIRGFPITCFSFVWLLVTCLGTSI